MKILHVLTAPRAEGTPRIVLDWLNQTDLKLTQELLFIHPEGELAETFQLRNEWQYYNTSFRIGIKSFHRLSKLVRDIVKEREPNIVICWNTGIAPWVAIGAKLGGNVKVLSHAGNFPGRKWSPHTLLHTNILAYTHLFTRSKIVCCSDYIRESYSKIPLTVKFVFKSVYNCISIDNFSPNSTWHDRKIDVIMVATLEGHKDHMTLLNAWSMLQTEYSNYSLRIVGDGSLRTVLRDKANELELRNVEFLGSRNDISSLLSSSKLFVFSTTIEEGFGTVLIEALASGCIVIASDVPACKEVLDNGRHGILVRKSSPEALCIEIKNQLVANSTTKNDSRKNLVDYLMQFNVTTMINNYISIANLT